MPTFDIENIETKTSWAINVDGERFFIGRSARAEVRLRHSSISRHHLLVERKDEGYQFVDLCSTNGTLVNDARRRQGTLANGDVLRMGAFRLRFSLSPKTETTTLHRSKDSSNGSTDREETVKEKKNLPADNDQEKHTAPPPSPTIAAKSGPAPTAESESTETQPTTDAGDDVDDRVGVWALVTLLIMLGACLGLGFFLGHLSALLD